MYALLNAGPRAARVTVVLPSAGLRCPACGHVEQERVLAMGAEVLRRALVEVALEAYEDAGLRGLCAEGRWEVAVSALRALDFGRVVVQPGPPAPGPRAGGRQQLSGRQGGAATD